MTWDPTITLFEDGEPVWSKTVSELEAWNWWKGWKPPTLEGYVPNDGPARAWVWVRGQQVPLTWGPA